jgi:signal transduction histidine kinase
VRAPVTPRAAAGGIAARAVPVVALLLVASAGILAATFLAAQAVETLATQSLESTARAISLAAEQILREGGGGGVGFERLFADRVVAYALLADAGGTVLFHTNPDLRGTRFEDARALAGGGGGASAGRRAVLGTGRPVWLSDHLVPRGDGRTDLLRVALHTAGADRLLARIGRLWWSVGAVLALLWGGGGLVVVLAVRSARLQRDLDRREALALVGQMTATLAHEIRNAIGSVKGYAQLVAEKTDAADARSRDLATVLRGVERIESLVGDLLAYAREERYALRAVDPEPLLRAAVAGAAPWRGTVVYELEPGVRVRADADLLERVLVNGVRNALQAMGDTGSLRLGAATRGERVAVRVEDSGEGIAPETLPRLFTPFFTTRAAGTGLGLAWAKKVVEGMGGSIALENRRDGRGAVLTLLLPRGGGGPERGPERGA